MSIKTKHLIFATSGIACAMLLGDPWHDQDDEFNQWTAIDDIREDDKPGIVVISLPTAASQDAVISQLREMGLTPDKVGLFENNAIADGLGCLRMEIRNALMVDLREAADHFACLLGQEERYEGVDMEYKALEAMMEGWAIGKSTAPGAKSSAPRI